MASDSDEELPFDEQRFAALLFDKKKAARKTFERLMTLDSDKTIRLRDAVIVVKPKVGGKRRYIGLRELTSMNADPAASGAAQGATMGLLYGLMAPLFLPLTVAAGAAAGAALGADQGDGKAGVACERGALVQDVVERHLTRGGNAVLLVWISHIKDRVRVGGVIGGCGGRVVDSNLSESRQRLIERLLAGGNAAAVAELEQLVDKRKRDAEKLFRTDKRSDDPNSWAKQLGWLRADGTPTSVADIPILLHPDAAHLSSKSSDDDE
jgi:uncharacterized membrane protein